MPIFMIANAVVLVFFGVLTAIGIRTRQWASVVTNGLGLGIVASALLVEFLGRSSRLTTMLFMATVLLVLLSDLLLTLRESSREVEEAEQDELARWLKHLPSDHYKMIGDEALLRSELESRERTEISDRLQALQMWKLANQAFLAKNYQEAVGRYEVSSNWVPTSLAYLNESGAWIELNEPEKAVASCDKALELRPDFFEALINKALALEKLKRYDEALATLQRAQQVKPETPEAWLLYGHVLRKMGEHEDAIAYLDKAIERDAQCVEAWYERGLACSKLTRHDQAREAFETVVALKPDHHHGHYNLGNILNKMERNEEAVRSYDRALKHKPNYPEAWNNRGIALSKMGKMRTALRSYEHALKLRPEYHEAWMNLGLALDSMGKYEKAIACYEEFVRQAPAEMKKHVLLTKRRIEELRKQVHGESPGTSTDAVLSGNHS